MLYVIGSYLPLIAKMYVIVFYLKQYLKWNKPIVRSEMQQFYSTSDKGTKYRTALADFHIFIFSDNRVHFIYNISKMIKIVITKPETCLCHIFATAKHLPLHMVNSDHQIICNHSIRILRHLSQEIEWYQWKLWYLNKDLMPISFCVRKFQQSVEIWI